MPKLFALLLMLAVGHACAQVTRCVDPTTKKVTYTDGPCKGGEAAKHIADKPSEAELERRELEARLGRLRHINEQLQADLRDIDRRAAERRNAGAVGMTGANNCTKARRNADVQESSIGRKGVPHAAIDAADSQCGTYTPRAEKIIAEHERQREQRRVYAPQK